jgi:hypothetical protein
MTENEERAYKQGIEELRDMIERARANFDRRIDEDLADAHALAKSLRSAIGEVSPEEAFGAWRRGLIKRLGGMLQ